MTTTVYLNGEYLPKTEAHISVDDRGFLLGDGVYEVTPFYEGAPFALDRHLERMRHGLEWLRIAFDTSSLEAVMRELVRSNGLEEEDRALVYLQVTRGAAPRTHYFPLSTVSPTVYAYAASWKRPAEETWMRGFRAITVPDRRWTRVDIKTIGLLPNVLAYQAARDAGVDDAILVRDGVAVEGAHQNFWAVLGGRAVTHPKTNLILPGITRDIVVELAAEEGIDVEERAIAVEELAEAEEVFFTGTTGEVRPCVEVDGHVVGDGAVGPVTRRLSDAFLRRIERTKSGASAGGG